MIDFIDGSSFIKMIKKYVPNIEECLNAPVENKKIDELEAISGKNIPECFRKLYLGHNGENEMVSGVMAGFRWMNIESIISNWKLLQNSAYDITSALEGIIQDGEFKKGWIPFAEDCGGSFLVMDLEPGIKGTSGQIITIDNDSSISYVVSENIQMFFEFIEKNFENGNLNTWQDGNVKIIDWKQGHLFDNAIALNSTMIKRINIPVSGFWAEYYKEDIVDGCISTEKLAKNKMLFISKDISNKHGEISLEILTNMINLTELIIHADTISDFKQIENIPSLKKLVIGSKSFRENDLEYIVRLKELKELTLVNLTLNDIGILQNIKTLKCLRLININELDCRCIGGLKNLKELSLENTKCDDLSYLSSLEKLTKLELQEINIPNLSFLRDLKKLTVFEADRGAQDEFEINIFEEMKDLKTLIYPIGDINVINKCVKLQAIGIDAVRLRALELLDNLNITDITIFNASSEENAKSLVLDLEKHCKLRSYGWRQTW